MVCILVYVLGFFVACFVGFLLFIFFVDGFFGWDFLLKFVLILELCRFVILGVSYFFKNVNVIFLVDLYEGRKNLL